MYMGMLLKTTLYTRIVIVYNNNNSTYCAVVVVVYDMIVTSHGVVACDNTMHGVVCNNMEANVHNAQASVAVSTPMSIQSCLV